jgi:hypothetical protein
MKESELINVRKLKGGEVEMQKEPVVGLNYFDQQKANKSP